MAYAHVPKDEREKLDSKSKTCVLLEHDSGPKGYRMYLENGCALHKINLMFLERSAYTKALLSRFGMDKANSVATPVDINADLVTTSDEVEDCDKDIPKCCR
ncbi:hypothetical protein FHG87_022698 [Trinorchestia longiramus]|nr:hypothetical protein FHG87_022698 [Trinorchestia longiramus]